MCQEKARHDYEMTVILALGGQTQTGGSWEFTGQPA